MFIEGGVVLNQYAVTKKNGACLLTTDKAEALAVGEKNHAEVVQIKPERKIIAFPLWSWKGDALPYYYKGAKFIGLIIDE